MAIIGRELPADIVVPAPQVSARHAEITHLGGDQFRLTDLGSLNGTYVKGQRIQSATIRLTDHVSLGSFVVDLMGLADRVPRVDGVTVASPSTHDESYRPPVPVGHDTPQRPTPGVASDPQGARSPSYSAPIQPKSPPIGRDGTPEQPVSQPQGSWKKCPSCGSNQVVSIAVFDQKNPKKLKVQGGGCSGCLGCLVALLLVVLLWPVLLALGLLGGVAGAASAYGMVRFVQQNQVAVTVGVFLLLAIAIAVKVSAPKFVCERCGNKFK